MIFQPAQQRFVEALAKHLPPSASRLRLLDIDGRCGDILAARRADLDVCCVAMKHIQSARLGLTETDAVVALDCEFDDRLLKGVAAIMRPGGRFIAVLSQGHVDESWVRLLECHGLVRILVETAVDGAGVLIRGEKPHAAAGTLERIQSVARADADHTDLDDYRGRYLHLLIRQSPNKPVWKLEPGESIAWRALALQRDWNAVLLVFSSLPKAVAFLQPAVLIDRVRDVNKVGKFDKAVAAAWQTPVILNPTLDSVLDQQLVWQDVDPDSAATPDE